MFGSSDPDNPMGGLLGDLMKVIGSGPGSGDSWFEAARTLAFGVATDDGQDETPDPLVRISFEDLSRVAADWRGQNYKLIRIEPYRRRDGRDTLILVWRSHCFECGAEFECSAPQRAFRGATRRCARHHSRKRTRGTPFLTRGTEECAFFGNASRT